MVQKEVEQDKIPEKQKKAKKEIEQVDDYFVKAAKEGSKYKPVNYFYSKGSTCEWCGNRPCAHMYVIEHKESGERLAIGSTCIEKVTNLGGSYDQHETFKKKVDKLAALKDKSKDEIKEEDVITIAELNEEIEEEIAEQEEEKQKKIEEQRETIEDENLDILKHYNDFCKDVLEQSHRRVLSDKQMSSLRDNKGYLLEDFDSVEEFEEIVELEKDLMIIVEELDRNDVIDGFWRGNAEHSGHVQVMHDFKENLRHRGHQKLTENQKDYMYSILQRYRKSVVPCIFKNITNSRIRDMNDEIKEEILYWDSGSVILRNKIKPERYGDLKVEEKGWEVTGFREEKDDAVSEVEERAEYDGGRRVDYKVCSVKQFVEDNCEESDVIAHSGSVKNTMARQLRRMGPSGNRDLHDKRRKLVNSQLEKFGEDKLSHDEYMELCKGGDSE